MKISLQEGTKGAPCYEQKELRSSGERRRRAFANGAGELSQCCRPRCRSFEKGLTRSLNLTIISCEL